MEARKAAPQQKLRSHLTDTLLTQGRIDEKMGWLRQNIIKSEGS
jgi:hypothetical protein